MLVTGPWPVQPRTGVCEAHAKRQQPALDLQCAVTTTRPCARPQSATRCDHHPPIRSITCSDSSMGPVMALKVRSMVIAKSRTK